MNMVMYIIIKITHSPSLELSRIKPYTTSTLVSENPFQKSIVVTIYNTSFFFNMKKYFWWHKYETILRQYQKSVETVSR